ncbi:MAG: hypothetical protein GY796_08835 [Chloroflexi bacterium]|nr:hypothetical protein [Chloroflexota bacterium]
MALQCDRCGQTVQESDRECWHCGVRLQTAVSTAPVTAVTATTPTAEDTPNPVSISELTFYTAATAVILILFLLLIWFLNRQPLLLVNPENRRPRGWTAVTDNNRQFTFDLPPIWQALDSANEDEAADFANRLAQPGTQAIWQKIETFAADAVPLMLLTNTGDEAPFILIAHSQTLQATSPKTFASNYTDRNTAVFHSELSQDFQGHNKVTLIEDILIKNETIRCQNQLVYLSQSVYWIALCTTPSNFALLAEDYNHILDGFQTLTPMY